jgi:hypothetical protein
MTTQERIDRGAEAQRLIQNPVYQQAKDKILQQIAYLRQDVPPRDTEGAMRLIQMEQTVIKTWMHLEAFVQDGDMAAKELEKAVTPLHRRVARKFRAA